MTRSLPVLAALAALAAFSAQAQQTSANTQFVPNEDVVRAVEQRLSALGYDVTPDGQYDAQLRNNVLRYQSDNGLRPTGNVDLATIGSLGIDLDPAGTTTARTTIDQSVAQAPVIEEPRYEGPFLRSEAMSSPQLAEQPTPMENVAGIPQPRDEPFFTGEPDLD